MRVSHGGGASAAAELPPRARARGSRPGQATTEAAAERPMKWRRVALMGRSYYPPLARGKGAQGRRTRHPPDPVRAARQDHRRLAMRTAAAVALGLLAVPRAFAAEPLLRTEVSVDAQRRFQVIDGFGVNVTPGAVARGRAEADPRHAGRRPRHVARPPRLPRDGRLARPRRSAGRTAAGRRPTSPRSTAAASSPSAGTRSATSRRRARTCTST
ncbi:MAG: hypothetical protein MZU95_14920 [Desulfomicrobium escambiense]|nr:hypothetical protein [Desulfomicrobium escambiense]